MYRSFSPLELVTVPRTSAASAMALGTALLTAARQEPKLPPRFVRSLERLEAECETLRASRTLRDEAQEIDASVANQADQDLDVAWSGLHNLLVGSTKLGVTPEGVERGARARAVLTWVFPSGLRFLTLPYRDQWAESQTKLDRLAEPAMAEHLEALGAGPFVRAVEAAYEAYGEALYLTKRKAEVKAHVKVREPLERVLDAVRRYVVQVAAYLDDHEDDAESQAMVRVLLEPLATWKSSGGGRKARARGNSGGEGPTGGSGGGPDEGSGDAFGEPAA
ncbi:MAG TPA: hypothetical protein VFS43_01705 [Polyangiaceae bacterium]|nr:hypothetical protein [Polyangiaceae bacterium]